ncbi:rhodanese-like domain-containing protein [Alloalcanivorax marinus]|uniref:rhodanese-like domain-containing protein n=1 Tax=Alloalcanivorax marinus TaxID=1177169 RepID=UPI0019346659|nr:hypothetical protein [Alloalcanivorax marinus]
MTWTLSTADQVRERWVQGREVAVLDVREEGPFSRAHPLFAASVPLSRLELTIRQRVPRSNVPLVVYDDGEGLAGPALSRLEALGYTNLSVLDGGLPAWSARGELYRDVNSASKAFGEWVEARYQVPGLAASEFEQRRRAGEAFLLVDARPFHEYQTMTIPGSVSCPGANLAARVPTLLTDPETPVVVNCAGRTRSLIGAQSLIDSGLPNPVYALRNGTIGWLLAGLELEYGARRRASDPDPASLPVIRERVRRHALDTGVRYADGDEYRAWLAEVHHRTTYFFDVRESEEVEAGPLAGFRHAPGGQLVQATDDYLAVRHARIVLADDDGVRAPMTASWLRRMGWRDVMVVSVPMVRAEAAPPRTAPPPPPDVHGVTPEQVDRWRREGAVVLDVSRSDEYRAAHVEGALQVNRNRLADAIDVLKVPGQRLVVTSQDGALANFAAADLKAHGIAVPVLAGGNRAWARAGLPLVSGEGDFFDVPDDCYRRPYEGTAHGREAMQGYIDWELELVGQLRRDGVAGFLI